MQPNLMVLPFTTPNHQYIYDAITNRIFHAPDPVYEVLQRYLNQTREEIKSELSPKYDTVAIESAYDRVKRWVGEGAFFAFALPNITTLTEASYWDSLLRIQGIKQLILIVTDNCNLRCRYCVYSGQYQGYRQHNLTTMSFETAKAAIGYFHQLHQHIFLPNKLKVINFYGGEPTLCFDLIRECVDYAIALDPAINFAITTNGTLVKQQHVEYFIKYKFNLVFSLDGPQPEHDRNRIYPNGKGTYHRTMQAIELVREKDPEYFRDHVMLSTVYDDHTDLYAVNDFFVNHKEELPRSGFVAPKRQGASSERNSQWESEQHDALSEQSGNLLRHFLLSKMQREAYDTVFLDRFWQTFRQISDRTYERLENLGHYTGRCLPGIKIAVRPDGTFHMCERVNERFPIGDISAGLDFERVRRVMEQYDQQVTQNCSTCVAVRFCQICYALACREYDFDATALCSSITGQLKGYLANLCAVLEENPKAFDDVKSRPRVLEIMTNC